MYPEGPDFIITISHDEKTGQLEYHGGDPRLDEIEPSAAPSRTQMEAFHKLWRKVETAVQSVPVSELSEFKGEVPPFQR